jgi:TatD DNase family protein
MTVHNRGAADEVLDALHERPNAGIAILHWFSGSKRQVDRAAAMGCWFSVGPPMFTSRKGAELVAAMPPHRVLTETDGPFAQREGRPLMPAEVGFAIERCAKGPPGNKCFN